MIFFSIGDEFEGVVHLIKDLKTLYLKFSKEFHQNYCGQLVNLRFQVSRAGHKRTHHAVNLAPTRLGEDTLFPKRVTICSCLEIFH